MRSSSNSRRKWLEVALFVVLWAAYFAFGFWLRHQISFAKDGELHGFDYNGHGVLFSNARMLLQFMRFRHPLFGFILSPIAFIGETICRDYSVWTYWGYLCAIFSAITTACVWLVWRISASLCAPGAKWRAAACTALFAAFGYVRYLAACPESFSISMFIWLALVVWAMRDRIAARDGLIGGLLPEEEAERAKIDRWVWGVFFVVATGITLTQGAKVALAYLVTHRLSRREWTILIGGFLALVAAGALFYVAKLVWFGDGGYTIPDAINYNLGFIFFESGLSIGRRLVALEMFFFEPIISHGAPYDVFEITEGYHSVWPYIVCFAIYAGAGWGAWRLRHTRLLRVLAAGFAVDALIHLVLFWGMKEGQIYCGHWFFILPILLAGICHDSDRRVPEKRA